MFVNRMREAWEQGLAGVRAAAGDALLDAITIAGEVASSVITIVDEEEAYVAGKHNGEDLVEDNLRSERFVRGSSTKEGVCMFLDKHNKEELVKDDPVRGKEAKGSVEDGSTEEEVYVFTWKESKDITENNPRGCKDAVGFGKNEEENGACLLEKTSGGSSAKGSLPGKAKLEVLLEANLSGDGQFMMRIDTSTMKKDRSFIKDDTSKGRDAEVSVKDESNKMDVFAKVTMGADALVEKARVRKSMMGARKLNASALEEKEDNEVNDLEESVCACQLCKIQLEAEEETIEHGENKPEKDIEGVIKISEYGDDDKEEVEREALKQVEYENVLEADAYYDEVLEDLIIKLLESHGLKANCSQVYGPLEEEDGLNATKALEKKEGIVEDDGMEYDDILLEQEEISFLFMKPRSYGKDLEQEIIQSEMSDAKNRDEHIHGEDKVEGESVGVVEDELVEVIQDEAAKVVGDGVIEEKQFAKLDSVNFKVEAIKTEKNSLFSKDMAETGGVKEDGGSSSFQAADAAKGGVHEDLGFDPGGETEKETDRKNIEMGVFSQKTEKSFKTLVSMLCPQFQVKLDKYFLFSCENSPFVIKKVVFSVEKHSVSLVDVNVIHECVLQSGRVELGKTSSGHETSRHAQPIRSEYSGAAGDNSRGQPVGENITTKNVYVIEHLFAEKGQY